VTDYSTNGGDAPIGHWLWRPEAERIDVASAWLLVEARIAILSLAFLAIATRAAARHFARA